MSLLDPVSAGVESAGTFLDRIDSDRIADFVADLAVADAVASAADLVTDQVVTVVEHGRRSSRTARIALVAGLLAFVVGGVIVLRRRTKRSAGPDITVESQARAAGAANPN